MNCRRPALVIAMVLPVLGGGAASLRAEFLKGPYLQNIGPDRITVMWESDTSLPGRVDYGTTPGGKPARGSWGGKTRMAEHPDQPAVADLFPLAKM